MKRKSVELDYKIEESNAIINTLVAEQRSLVCSTKFGPHSLVFLHLITRISSSIPVVWVDTGYNKRATVLFVEHANSLLDLNLKVFRPTNHVIRIPPQLGDVDHASFAEEVKLAPFRDALSSLNATHWLSSVRAYQTANRSQLDVSTKLANGLTKVHPMLNWTLDDMEGYLERHQLPTAPETFDPTKGESFRECGLHEQRSWK